MNSNYRPIRSLQEIKEAEAKRKAKETQKAITYTDDDGCEVTVTQNGDIFYNASDWY